MPQFRCVLVYRTTQVCSCASFYVFCIIAFAGPVIVSKMPALHPGDVRKLKAVAADRVPGLTHMHDVIVFPREVVIYFSKFFLIDFIIDYTQPLNKFAISSHCCEKILSKHYASLLVRRMKSMHCTQLHFDSFTNVLVERKNNVMKHVNNRRIVKNIRTHQNMLTSTMEMSSMSS